MCKADQLSHLSKGNLHCLNQINNRNKVKFCHSPAIKASQDVDAFIIQNELSINDVGIELHNNKSQLVENLIEKSHENGV